MALRRGTLLREAQKNLEKEEKIRIQIRDLHCLLGLVLGPIPKQGGRGPVQDS